VPLLAHCRQHWYSLYVVLNRNKTSLLLGCTQYDAVMLQDKMRCGGNSENPSEEVAEDFGNLHFYQRAGEGRTNLTRYMHLPRLTEGPLFL
jgi:hypothetical protein